MPRPLPPRYGRREDHRSVIDEVHADLSRRAAAGERWAANHLTAWRNQHGANEATALRDMVLGLARYCDAYRKRYDTPIGDDGVLGENAADIAHGIIGLLNGELGGLDGGTMDRLVRNICHLSDIRLD